jgi:hypothetical protein
MKEIRPSTWVVLGILTLFIFAPLFLLDIEPIQQLVPANHPANPENVRPSDPRATNTEKPQNKPANDPPPANEPDVTPPANGTVD